MLAFDFDSVAVDDFEVQSAAAADLDEFFAARGTRLRLHGLVVDFVAVAVDQLEPRRRELGDPGLFVE
jgi:hypothetical protein